MGKRELEQACTAFRREAVRATVASRAERQTLKRIMRLMALKYADRPHAERWRDRRIDGEIGE